ncbi:helix-turn-helix domain protein [Segniliparus rotundus DSM 44985]|uniref:Helix-turn-helix domain protein n=1 Tax=Segniliparus rotundus (strain ATCC BAA-972 / CDC 1076 / CIP 108378 / DSM 44985 / JCM 13578) TaxID=640132 RepID=D6ZFD5_SEGRD|nr:helix-turn-helix transcriptional regulator [Segniliparus rotundus]ADG97659.1 helix-turn-helix domain protein [Segniliparus rotundus DSM 44985]
MPIENHTLSDAVAAEVRALLARRDMTRAQLAEKIGVEYPVLCRAVKGQRPWRLDELQKVADALAVPVAQLLPAWARELGLGAAA